MAAALAAVLACQTFPAFGGAAPDGKTLAQDTEAAQGGAYDAWKERWKELSGDWTQVSITPGADETPVSYTHLDVYKRQIQGTAGANIPQGSRCCWKSI